MSIVFSLIFENWTFFPYSSILSKNIFGHFKSKISKCPDLIGILPPVLTHIMPYNTINKQMFLYHLIMITANISVKNVDSSLLRRLTLLYI